METSTPMIDAPIATILHQCRPALDARDLNQQSASRPFCRE
jgi:hypothetical protein